VPHARGYRPPVLLCDAANTLIFAVTLYLTRPLLLRDKESMIVIVLSILAAIPAEIGRGRAVDRFGTRRALDIVLILERRCLTAL
jgi:hypothetical protein